MKTEALTQQPEVLSDILPPGTPAGYQPNILEKISGVAVRASLLLPTIATRLLRAIGIVANPHNIEDKGEGAYRVKSQSSRESYQLTTEPDHGFLVCTCQDFTVQEQDFCKHVLAVRLLQSADEVDRGKLPRLISDIKKTQGAEKQAKAPYDTPF